MKHAFHATSTIVLGAQLALFGCDGVSDASATEGPETSPALATVEQCYVVSDVDSGTGADVLFVVDKTDPSATSNLVEIGSLGANAVEAIAFDPVTRVLYAADADQLGTVDLATGAFLPLEKPFGAGPGAQGTLSFNDVDGLAFDPRTGTLYGSVRRDGKDNLPDLLIVIDPATGAHRPDAFGPGVDYVVIPPVDGNVDIDDIAIDIDGQMFAIANTGGKNDRLVVIDKASGQSRDIGATVIDDVEGMAFDPQGQLWGSAGEHNTLYRLDKVTGEASTAVPLVKGDFTDFEALDCMTVPVGPLCDANPEAPGCIEDPTYNVTGGGCSASQPASPGTALAMLLCGFVLILVWRRRTIPH